MSDYYHPDVEVRRSKPGDNAWPLRWVGVTDTSPFGLKVEFMALSRKGVLRQIARRRRKEERAAASSGTV